MVPDGVCWFNSLLVLLYYNCNIAHHHTKDNTTIMPIFSTTETYPSVKKTRIIHLSRKSEQADLQVCKKFKVYGC